MVVAASCCFSAARTVKLVRIEGKMNRAKYREILKNLLQSAQNLRWGDNSPYTFLNTQIIQHRSGSGTSV